MKKRLAVFVILILVLSTISIAEENSEFDNERFNDKRFNNPRLEEGNFDDKNFEKYQRNEMDSRDRGPNYEGFSREEMLFGRIFERLDDKIDPEQLMAHCNNPEKIADIVMKLAKEEFSDVKDICNDMKKEEDLCYEESDSNCEMMGGFDDSDDSGDELEKLEFKAHSCPPDETALFELCKLRSKEHMESRLEDVDGECELRWDYESINREEFCDQKSQAVCSKDQYISQCIERSGPPPDFDRREEGPKGEERRGDDRRENGRSQDQNERDDFRRDHENRPDENCQFSESSAQIQIAECVKKGGRPKSRFEGRCLARIECFFENQDSNNENNKNQKNDQNEGEQKEQNNQDTQTNTQNDQTNNENSPSQQNQQSTSSTAPSSPSTVSSSGSSDSSSSSSSQGSGSSSGSSTQNSGSSSSSTSEASSSGSSDSSSSSGSSSSGSSSSESSSSGSGSGSSNSDSGNSNSDSITGNSVNEREDHNKRRCTDEWNNQKRYCADLERNCDKNKFVEQCVTNEKRGSEKFLSNLDKQCKIELKRELSRVKRECKRFEKDKERCLRDSKKRCEHIEGLSEQCKEQVNEKTLREFIIKEAKKHCRLGFEDSGKNSKTNTRSNLLEVIIATDKEMINIKLLNSLVDSAQEIFDTDETSVYKANVDPKNLEQVRDLDFVTEIRILKSNSQEKIKSKNVAANLASLREDSKLDKETEYLITEQADQILDASEDIEKLEKTESRKSLSYKFKRFLGLQKEAEEEEIKNLQDSKSRMEKSTQSLSTLMDQIEDPVMQAVIREQIQELKSQNQEMEELIKSKQKRAKGIMGMFG